MSRLVEIESADPALGAGGQRRLIESFNAGFSARTAQFPGCRPDVRSALEAAAAKGEALARRLAGGATP
jgi:predicted secreted protein